MGISVIYTCRQTVRGTNVPSIFFSILYFLLLKITEVEPEMLFCTIYGLDHMLQYESYLIK